MFNQIISDASLPKYLSSDNDPLFLFHRWQANLRILEIEEIKSIPGTPTSHPFIERVIRTTRNDCLDQVLFFNKYDLQRKLDLYQNYYNEVRAHSSLAIKRQNRWLQQVFSTRPLRHWMIIDGVLTVMDCLRCLLPRNFEKAHYRVLEAFGEFFRARNYLKFLI